MKSKSGTKAKTDLRESIIKAYIKAVMTEGKNPTSIFLFADQLGIEEVEFYEHFASFDAIQEAIWKDMLVNTQTRLKESPEYEGFLVREKLLAFYYTLFEELLKNRSYASWSVKGWMNPLQNHPVRNQIQAENKTYFEALIEEGYQTGELINRKIGSKPNLKALELLFWFLLEFWLNDNSPKMEDSDAAVEKAVNLTMDLMKENTLDKAIDFGRFLAGRFMPN